MSIIFAALYVSIAMIWTMYQIDVVYTVMMECEFYDTKSQVLLIVYYMLLWPRWVYKFAEGYLEALKEFKKEES